MITTKTARIRLSPAERRERVALAVTVGKSNRAVAKELGVDEGTVRRDRKLLARPVEDRPVAENRPVTAPVPKMPVRELSPDKIRQRRLEQLLETAQLWITEQGLILPDIEYVLDKAGKLLYLHRDASRRVPIRVGTPDELLILVRPKEAAEDYRPAKLDFWPPWLARWLALVCQGTKNCRTKCFARSRSGLDRNRVGSYTDRTCLTLATSAAGPIWIYLSWR